MQRPGGAQRIPRPADWRLNPLEPWAADRPVTVDEVVSRIRGASRIGAFDVAPFADARPSAVLIALADGPHGAEVLLTKRSQQLRNHAGEISFPGGRLEGDETAEQAALREASEEVGLRNDEAVIVGRLSHVATIVSRSFIVPIVATVATRRELVPHDQEVDTIFWLPIAELVRADTFHEELWGDEPSRKMPFFELDDETIWGVTARVLSELLEILYGPPASRTAP